jgi:hypothetical protein
MMGKPVTVSGEIRVHMSMYMFPVISINTLITMSYFSAIPFCNVSKTCCHQSMYRLHATRTDFAFN